MCTAFVRRGDDLVVGFNFDLAEDAFRYKIVKNPEMFYIAITAGSRTYKTHGVNRCGNAGNLPYRNGAAETRLRRGKDVQRLDLLNERYIGGEISYAQLLETVKTKTLVDIPRMSMHSQFTDRDGHILIAEPGSGYREVDGRYSILTNFPVLEPPADLSAPWYGADRYRAGLERLRRSTDAFGVEEGLALLRETKQEGEWATRISFLYSAAESAVYYVLNRDFDHVSRHAFG